VICKRNGNLVFVCRVAWTKHTQLIETHARLYISNHRITEEGERLYSFREIDIQEPPSGFIFLALPYDIVHEINEDSPLYRITPEDLYKNDIEFIIVIEGISAYTSDTVQGHYSYLPSDVVWDRYLPNIVTQNSDRSFSVDFTNFDTLVHPSALINSNSLPYLDIN